MARANWRAPQSLRGKQGWARSAGARGLCCLALAGSSACADVDDSPAGPDASPSIGFQLDAGLAAIDGNDPVCQSYPPTPFLFKDTDILILFDRSESMNTMFDERTRYQKLAGVLSDLVETYAGHVRFAYQEMPGPQNCGDAQARGCCASAPMVALAANNAGPVQAAMAAAQRSEGNTPTAAALKQALAYYQAFPVGVASRNVLLATEGAPNCTLFGSLSGQPFVDESGKRLSAACRDAVDQIAQLRAANIQTLVLGLGPTPADTDSDASDCLEAMAQAGGAATAKNGQSYYAATSSAELQLAIEQMFAGNTPRPRCFWPLTDSDVDVNTIRVYLDGKLVPHSDDDYGWSLSNPNDPPAVQLGRGYCNRVERFRVGSAVVCAPSPKVPPGEVPQ